MSFFVDLKILIATVLSLAGQWPVPLSWIVSLRPEKGAAPASVAVRAVAEPKAAVIGAATIAAAPEAAVPETAETATRVEFIPRRELGEVGNRT
jgi:hypothetical protein